MKLENGRELLFAQAYFNRQYVNVPLVHLPEDAITNEGDIAFFRFVPVDNPPKVDPLPMRESKAAKKYPAIAKVTIDPEELSDEDLKQLCKRNDIPLAWVTNRFSKKVNRSSGSSRRLEKRKITTITQDEFRKIIRELKKLNRQSAVIIEILWFFNSRLEEAGEYVTLEEILRVMVQDFSPEEEVRPAQICLKRHGKSSRIISHHVPEELGRSISKQIKRDSMFVFSNRHGGPLLTVKVDSELKIAAANAGVKNITSLSLRPKFDKSKVAKNAENHQKKVLLNDCPKQITEQEWEMICSRIPALNQSKGRKSTYSSRDILNAILYHLKEPCPLRKLPPLYPPWRAIDSQFRRWKKKGVLDEILGLFAERSAD
jgi:integrase